MDKISNYQPKPIDTSLIKLPKDLEDLTEVLAHNAHDVWSKQRMADGWSYGGTRNDIRKEHPSLVPYAQLPESEKQMDRNAAMETIKAILALGYKIYKPEP